jgi:hypothetical protein
LKTAKIRNSRTLLNLDARNQKQIQKKSTGGLNRQLEIKLGGEHAGDALGSKTSLRLRCPQQTVVCFPATIPFFRATFFGPGKSKTTAL